MKRITIIGGLLLSLALSSTQLWAAPHLKLAPGEAAVLYDFEDPDPGEYASPEGIAFDQKGNMYISLRTKTDAGNAANEIIKLTPRGDESVFAAFGPTAPGASGVLGLDTDPKGNVYVAFDSPGTLSHGVTKISRDGTTWEHLIGSELMHFPDDVIIDPKGNIYITDYDPGLDGTHGVWKYSKKDGECKPWASDPLLVGGLDPLGQEMGGANGIVFDPPNHIYVSNTQQSLLAHVEVMKDGSAGPVSLVAAGPPLLNPDGLTIDAHGNVYAVIPISTFPPEFFPLPPLSPVVRIIPETGEMQPVLDYEFPDLEYFDIPSGLAFGKGPRDHKSVFVVQIGAINFGFPFEGSGPKLTQVGVGIPGHTGK